MKSHTFLIIFVLENAFFHFLKAHQCTDGVTSSGATNVMMVSGQNATGHWLTKVRLDHAVGTAETGAASSDGGVSTLQPVAVEVQRSARHLKGGLHAVTLEATLTGSLPSPPGVLPTSTPHGTLPTSSTQGAASCPSPAPCPSLPPLPPPPPPLPCHCPQPSLHGRAGYDHYPLLGYYRLHLAPVNWFEAKATCEREGAHLAILNSKEEAEMVASYYQKYPIPEYPGIFVGIHDLIKENQFYTVFGQPLKETGWSVWKSDAEPNNMNNKEHCLAVWSNAGYNDVPCDIKASFICELPNYVH